MLNPPDTLIIAAAEKIVAKDAEIAALREALEAARPLIVTNVSWADSKRQEVLLSIDQALAICAAALRARQQGEG